MAGDDERSLGSEIVMLLALTVRESEFTETSSLLTTDVRRDLDVPLEGDG